MDQMASSVGGIITIDFADTEQPVIRQAAFDFGRKRPQTLYCGHGGNHADLTHEYAAVPAEMKAVANSLGVDFLRQTSLDALIPGFPSCAASMATARCCGPFIFCRITTGSSGR